MKYAVILLATALFAPFALAGSNTQTGTQSGNAWSEATVVTVQAGTGFSLTSATADFDIFFFDANGNEVGASIACGPDAGTVPGNAATAEVRKWDDIGGVAPATACQEPLLGLPGVPGDFSYTDGL